MVKQLAERSTLRFFVEWGIALAIVVGVGYLMMPNLSITRKQAPAQNSKAHLRVIYQGICEYHDEFQRIPAEYYDLIQTDILPLKVLIDPQQEDYRQRFNQATQWSSVEVTDRSHEAEIRPWIQEHHDYVILWNRVKYTLQNEKQAQTHGQILVLGHAKVINGKVTAVLFSDGHAESFNNMDFHARMQKSDQLWAEIQEGLRLKQKEIME